MKPSRKTVWLSLTLTTLLAAFPPGSEAKSYSSGGGHSYSSSSSHHSSSSGSHSYSSGSTRSASSGGGRSSSTSPGSSRSGSSSASSSGTRGSSHSFQSGSGKSYTSGSSTASDTTRRSYSSGKSYTGGSGSIFSSSSTRSQKPKATSSSAPAAVIPEPRNDSSFTFDTAAARARQEEASRAEFQRFKTAQAAPGQPAPATVANESRTVSTAPAPQNPGSYRVTPPPLPGRPPPSYTYIPDQVTISTRPYRIGSVFNPYASRPVVVYHDPYSSFFWWWLLDRSLEDRAWWTYHHRYDMDPARYQALVSSDQQLEARVEALEVQQPVRDPAYTPAGLDRDLMYSDNYVARTYSNRPTMLGTVAFFMLGIPTAIGVCALFIWLVWFKRWQTAT